MLLKQGCSQNFIATTIDKDRSVISREIKHNSSLKRGVYNCYKAQKKSDFRKQRFHRRRTFTKEKRDFIEEHLKKGWSPEQIVGYCKKHSIAMVSHETIFQYIREDRALGGVLYTYLRNKLKHRKRAVTGKHVVIKDKVSIDYCPDIVNRRGRFLRLGYRYYNRQRG